MGYAPTLMGYAPIPWVMHAPDGSCMQPMGYGCTLMGCACTPMGYAQNPGVMHAPDGLCMHPDTLRTHPAGHACS